MPVLSGVPRARSSFSAGASPFSRWSGLDKQAHWDRSVEIRWSHPPPSLEDNKKQQNEMFRKTRKVLAHLEEDIDGGPRPIENSRGYLGLPDGLRFRVMREVLSAYNSGKKVRMNPAIFFEPVWPVTRKGAKRMWTADYFDSLSEVLAQVHRYTSVCFGIRVDVLATLFLTKHFHVVYAPAVSEEDNCAAVRYMERFGSLMRTITLEVDVSGLAGGWDSVYDGGTITPAAVGRVGELVKKFVSGQLLRAGTEIMLNLEVLVRRWYVLQQHLLEAKPIGQDGRPDSPAVPSPSVDTLSILDPLRRLGPFLNSFCIAGADRVCAQSLNSAFWKTDRPPKGVRLLDCAPSRAYPYLPGQCSVIDYGPHFVQAVPHSENPRLWRGHFGCRLSSDAVVIEIPGENGEPSKYHIAPPKSAEAMAVVDVKGKGKAIDWGETTAAEASERTDPKGQGKAVGEGEMTESGTERMTGPEANRSRTPVVGKQRSFRGLAGLSSSEAEEEKRVLGIIGFGRPNSSLGLPADFADADRAGKIRSRFPVLGQQKSYSALTEMSGALQTGPSTPTRRRAITPISGQQRTRSSLGLSAVFESPEKNEEGPGRTGGEQSKPPVSGRPYASLGPSSTPTRPGGRQKRRSITPTLFRRDRSPSALASGSRSAAPQQSPTPESGANKKEKGTVKRFKDFSMSLLGKDKEKR